jgi:Mn-dependent DtxR family transcriptional regulator
MNVKETLENYVETIYILNNEMGRIRSIDLCKKMNVSKPTISVALKKFKAQGYLDVDEDGSITLTDIGSDIAVKMYKRHTAIAEIFMKIGVDEKTAFEDSCKIEHDISSKTFECLKKYFNINK